MTPVDALAAVGCDAAWFAARDAAVGLTARVARARLEVAGLWRFVGQEDGSTRGCFHFRATDVGALQRALAAHARFTAPRAGPRWQSRERRLSDALHIKHFDGWPPDRVQVHVDRAGLPQRGWWWVMPLVPAVLWLRHVLRYHSYLDVEAAWRRL